MYLLISMLLEVTNEIFCPSADILLIAAWKGQELSEILVVNLPISTVLFFDSFKVELTGL